MGPLRDGNGQWWCWEESIKRVMKDLCYNKVDSGIVGRKVSRG